MKLNNSQLENTAPIKEQIWEKDITPMVSVSCITFNHEKYIRDAIEGFLMQKTTFPVEILIHDDASTDNTANIVREYEAKYPQLIKPIYQEENQYSKGVKIGSTFQHSRAKGKYYAACEGDDYWTDPLKLQKQVEFMEENEDYSLCFHNAKVIYEGNNKAPHKFKELETRQYSGGEILKEWTIPTASVMFRMSMFNPEKLSNPNFLYGDIVLFLSLAENGKLWGCEEVMSVYRKHESGITSDKSIEKKIRFIKHHEEIQKTFTGTNEVEKQILSRSYIDLSKEQLKKLDIRFVKSLYIALKNNPPLFINNLIESYL